MTRSSRFRLRLNSLESRIAPASLFQYTDVDGDKVTVAVSTGTLTAGLFTTVARGVGEQLQMIDLSGGGFDGANLTVSVARMAGGDGLANVGYISAAGQDLGRVTVRGDLGRIDAGDANTATPGLRALVVRSLGRLGTDTQGAGGHLASFITGALGALVVAGDVKDALVRVTGGPDGKIGAIRIGGSLIGGSFADSGNIASDGDMGLVKIGHDVQGGSGVESGFIYSSGNLAGVTVGGSLIGGSNSDSGEIKSIGDMGAVKIGRDVLGGSGIVSGFVTTNGKLAGLSIGGSLIGGSNGDTGRVFSAGDMGAVKIGHDVQGGSGSYSGLVESGGKLAGVSIGGSLLGGSGGLSGGIGSVGKFAGVSIGGSLLGGSGGQSGMLFSTTSMGVVKIGHDLTGGSITGAGSLDYSGVIESLGRISSVTIGGSIISGIDTGNGALTWNATIRAGDDIGSLTVRGSLIGHGETINSDASPVVISARGQAVQGATTDLAIGRIRIGGRVEFANILAGYDVDLTPRNGDAQVGAVSVGGDWAASNLVAGAMNLASFNRKFGDGNDISIGAGTAGIIAKIASVTVGGQVYGTPDSDSSADHYGFVAEQVVSITIGGVADALSPGPSNNAHPVGETTDMAVFEV